MSILERIFAKKGIKGVSDLDKEEQADFEKYEAILSKGELSMEDMKHFLQDQIRVIESKWKDYSKTTYDKADLIPYHTIYKTLLDVINSPQVERENLEKYLIQLHNL